MLTCFMAFTKLAHCAHFIPNYCTYLQEEREATQLKGPKRSIGMLHCVDNCRCISKGVFLWGDLDQDQ